MGGVPDYDFWKGLQDMRVLASRMAEQ